MSLQRPTTATASIWLAVGVLVLSGVSAVLTVVFRDEVLAAWRAGRDDSSSIEQPAFVPVALVMYVVVALLMWVLLMFFREGHNWARRSIVALFLLMGVGILAVLRTEPPTVFLVLCGLTLVVDLVAVGCLLHKDTRTWCHEGVPV
jgi:drug/metabolite transporter (DMT)-like permease